MYWDFNSDLRMGYKPIKTQEPLDFGTAIHTGLQTWYENFDMPYEVKLSLMIKSFIDKNEEQYKRLKDNPHYFTDHETRVEFDNRIDLGTGMLNHYADYSMKNDKFKVLEVEKKFRIPLIPVYENPQEGEQVGQVDYYIYYEGKIDLIVEDEYGCIYVVDHKTTSKMGQTDWLDVDTQISSYCWALWMLGYDVSGFIYNQIFKGYPDKPKLVYKDTKLSKDKQQNTTYELYWNALIEYGFDVSEYEDMLDHLLKEPKQFVRRRQVERSQHELQYQNDIIYKEASDMLENPNIYPSPSDFNCNYCPYFAPCLATQEQGDPYEFLDDPELFVKEARSD